MATTMTGLLLGANVGNCGWLVSTRRSWANKVKVTANGIAVCAGKISLAATSTASGSEVNLTGTFYSMRAEIAHFLENGGGAIIRCGRPIRLRSTASLG